MKNSHISVVGIALHMARPLASACTPGCNLSKSTQKLCSGDSFQQNQ
jgi:hypothetical protein